MGFQFPLGIPFPLLSLLSVSGALWLKSMTCFRVVSKILAKARLNKKNVRVVGNGHSPSDIACTPGYMISLRKFSKILEVGVVEALG